MLSTPAVVLLLVLNGLCCDLPSRPWQSCLTTFFFSIVSIRNTITDTMLLLPLLFLLLLLWLLHVLLA